MSRSTLKPKLQVNYEAVHQLYPSEVPERADERRALDIVAFHGMQLGDGGQAWKGTWTNEAGDCWLLWLPQELQKTCRGGPVRVLSISYNAQATGHLTGVYGRRNQGHQDISEELFAELLRDPRWSLGSKPFVLVGHSYGGIVIKSLVANNYRISLKTTSLNPVVERASQLATQAMVKLRGIVYYGIPQRGSELATFIYRSNRILPLMWLGKVFKDLTFDQEIERLTENFEDAISKCRDLNGGRGIAQYAFAESKRTHHVMVVKAASAKGNLDSTAFQVLTGKDHRTECKPYSKDDSAFSGFVNFLNEDVIKRDPVLSSHRPPAPAVAAPSTAPDPPPERKDPPNDWEDSKIKKKFQRTRRRL